MEGYAYNVLELKQISSQNPFCLRYRLQDSLLETSIEKRGIVTPLVVSSHDSGAQIISGHKRWFAAKNLNLPKIPVFILQEKKSEKDLFWISVLSNWNQRWNEIDRTWCLKKAVELSSLSQEEIIHELMPILGFSPEKNIFEQCLSMSQLHPALLEMVASEKLPYRGAQFLLRFKASDQETFARDIAAQVSLTTNELLQVSENLYDLIKRENKALRELLTVHQCDKILKYAERNPRQKAEQFCRRIRQIRNPQWTEKEKQFESVASKVVENAKDLKIEAPAYFEDEGFNLQARVRNPEALEKLIHQLQDQKKLLNSLFDIML